MLLLLNLKQENTICPPSTIQWTRKNYKGFYLTCKKEKLKTIQKTPPQGKDRTSQYKGIITSDKSCSTVT